MERFNETFKDHELTFSDLKKSDTDLIGYYQAFYNYTKKHIGLDGKTPTEASNIKVKVLTNGKRRYKMLVCIPMNKII